MTQGHQVHGEGHHFSRLSEEDVLKIQFLLEQREKARKIMEGLTYERIARRFNVGKNAIYHLAKGNSWRHLLDKKDDTG